MEPSALHPGDQVVLDPPGLQALIDLLFLTGYRVLGPTEQDGAVVYDDIASIDDLPVGWTDEQKPGRYRLNKRHDHAFFGYAVGPHSWKKFLNPVRRTLFRVVHTESGIQLLPEAETAPRYAFLGARPCELAALAIQDRVYLGGPYPHPAYKARREQAFLVAVNCSEPGGTCFCGSMGIGPKASPPYDLALTEVLDRKRHFFLMEIGSQAGATVAGQLPVTPPEESHVQAAEAVMKRAAGRMERDLPTAGLREALQDSYEHPRWDAVAQRCLTCGNCTAVCPTCFCTTVEDVTDITGATAERQQRSDSCFTQEFSYIFGGSVRSSPASRYRQWLVHKLSTWHDQFGTPGCVGCGRCITWCPVGIDITEEARAIHASAPNGKEQAGGNA